MTISEPDTTNAGHRIRFLARSADRAALGTLMSDGTPYVSLVELATDGAGDPVVLLSDLAQHTVNLRASPAASLLLDGTGGTGLDGPRATLVGHVEPAADEAARARYLARHPHAAAYAAFADFGLYRFRVARGHLVAGFGRIAWADRADIVLGDGLWEGLQAGEAGIVSHMNEDHADALELYATALKGAAPGPWRMCGIDAEGFDIAEGSRRERLIFDTLVGSSGEARSALVDLVKQARRAAIA